MSEFRGYQRITGYQANGRGVGKQRRRLLPVMTFIAITSVASGCSLTDSRVGPPRPTRFSEHTFAAECGNTLSCRIVYANRAQVNEHYSATYTPVRSDLLTRSRGGQIAIRNFPGPATVSWHSLDGSKHEAIVDFSSIFRNRTVLHADPVEDVMSGGVFGDPTIFLVVDDRTVRVYMESMVFLKTAPDRNDTSGVTRHDSVLAYSKEY